MNEVFLRGGVGYGGSFLLPSLSLFFIVVLGGLDAFGKSFVFYFNGGGSFHKLRYTVLCQLFGDRLGQPWNFKAQERT